jgi:hypothetical protein
MMVPNRTGIDPHVHLLEPGQVARREKWRHEAYISLDMLVDTTIDHDALIAQMAMDKLKEQGGVPGSARLRRWHIRPSKRRGWICVVAYGDALRLQLNPKEID